VKPKMSVDDAQDDIVHPSTLPFVLVHAACFAALWSGITWPAVATGAGLYWLRMFAVGAGYHRYFSHRSYATSRLFQFVLAFLAQTSAQKSVLWWAAKHRHHHLHSDTPDDVHSPRVDASSAPTTSHAKHREGVSASFERDLIFCCLGAPPEQSSVNVVLRGTLP
jgi:stearoyl-CoA desaturase (delta-9 desaturase)